ncbi:hypothetical protein CASFOL_009171 [Castilleja foliolosa]|uniref:Methyltransferase domain-containing protein n=1 Tax=Castilleja foliolosa TaxID=1961234 RepID=A0ABD3E1K0_9LAMI
MASSSSSTPSHSSHPHQSPYSYPHPHSNPSLLQKTRAHSETLPMIQAYEEKWYSSIEDRSNPSGGRKSLSPSPSAVMVHGGDWLRFGLRRRWVPGGMRRRNGEKYSGGGLQLFELLSSLNVSRLLELLLNDLLSLGAHRVWKRMTVSWSGAKEGDTVLDVCCGSGGLAFLLSEKVGINGKVFALDFSKEQLHVAESRQSKRSKTCYKNIEWIEGDAVDLEFSASFFDAATIGYGLRKCIR